MGPFFKKHQAHGEIVLPPKPGGDNFNSSPDHFLSHEIVAGSAEFRLPHGVKFSNCKITLKGSIKTTTETTEKGAVSKSWRTERLPFLGVLFERRSKEGFEHDDGTLRVPFRFDLSECEKLAAFISNLPPSIDSKEEGQRSSDPQYEIKYSITATAFSPRGTIASASQRIFIDAVSTDALSDTSSEGPGEYFWATQSISRSKSEKTRSDGPRFELAGQEPSDIVLNADDNILEGSTDVPFIVKILPKKGYKLRQEDMPKECKVKAQLITKTHMTPDGIKGIASSMSLDYIKVDGKTTTKVQNGHHQDRTVTIKRWERSVDDSTEPFAVARFTFPFRLEGGVLPLPSFYTPILSRRYLIDLTLSFDGSDDTFRLSIPVELVHGSADLSEYDDTRKKSDGGVTFTPSKPGPRFDRRAFDRRATEP